MSFINTKWLNFLGLSMPTTVDEFEQVLIAFRDNAASIKAEYGIDGDIIPMSCIVNNGDQDPSILINGFGEGYGDADKDRHIAVTNDRKVICAATQQGYRDGLDWLHKLYAEKLIDRSASRRSGPPMFPRARLAAMVSASAGMLPTLTT